MWFDSLSDIGRVLAVGASAYVALLVVLRLSGKRTLAKLNAFDLVVTVALGSTLATILLSSDVSYAEGVVALALLALLQFLVAWFTSRWPVLRAVVTAEPTLLLRDGQVIPEALREQRVGIEEVRQAVRSTGSGDLATVGAVVLETDGSLSVIPAEKLGDGSTLVGVRGTDRVPDR
jgi:uncharacterized membrane protein YcaP (DUF421 family)